MSIVNGCGRHHRSCPGPCASYCPVRGVACSAEHAVWIFAAVFDSHCSRPGRRYALWQGASEAWAVPVSISVKVLRSLLRVHCEIEDTRSTDTACEVISGAPVADKMTAANGRTPKKGPQNCGSFLSFQVQLLSQAWWRATTAANATIPAFLLSLRPAGRPGVRASVDTHARSGRRPLEVSFPLPGSGDSRFDRIRGCRDRQRECGSYLN